MAALPALACLHHSAASSIMERQQAKNTVEQAKLDFIQQVLKKRVEFEENGVKKKGEVLWYALATFVLEELKHLREQDPIVDAAYSFRIKSDASLQGKIERMQKSGKCQTLASIRAMRWDIAGTRVCLYFPCQMSQVKDFIQQNEHFEVIPYTFENGDGCTTPKPIEQLAKPFREREYTMRDPETRPYQERMGYYGADHYWIRLKKTHPRVREKIPNYENEEIEIQVRTVLMDAWAEIRHDLDYKHMLGYPSANELQVLDAIKGQISTCEIMQDHLFILREQRIKRDSQPFDRDEPEQYWRAIVNSLQPRHRLLLSEFGDERPGSDFMLRIVARFFENYGVSSPRELMNQMAGLVVTREQKQAIQHAQESFPKISALYSSQNRRSPDLSLSRFVLIFLLTKHGFGATQKKNTVMTLDDNSDMIIAYPEVNASQEYAMLGNVLEVLDDWLDDTDDDDDLDLYTETVSVTFHVHEWIATIYQNEKKFNQILDIIIRLGSHYRKLNDNIWNRRALWLCAVAAFVRFELSIEPTGHFNPADWDRGRASCGLTPLKEDWECMAWRKGEQLAAEIIGVELAQLKNATLYRALCQCPHENEYALHCLEDKGININWQDKCGVSLLGAAAAFGTREICQKMLACPGVNVNMAFPDGLGLIHIAIVHGNRDMVELLTSNRNLDNGAIWRSDGNTSLITRHWTAPDGDLDEDWTFALDEYERPCDKFSWTPLEMAGRQRDLERPGSGHIYNLVQRACKVRGL